MVVSDRIRENLRKFKRMEINELLNLSINETLSRTILTGTTTIAVLLALYFFGGSVIRNFTFAMLFGVVVGTYSSIFIAAPILEYLGIKRETIVGNEVGRAAVEGVRAGSPRVQPLRARRADVTISRTGTTGAYPGRAPIEAYGNGGFRFAGMSHRGSILCLPDAILAWSERDPAGLTPASFAAVLG